MASMVKLGSQTLFFFWACTNSLSWRMLSLAPHFSAILSTSLKKSKFFAVFVSLLINRLNFRFDWQRCLARRNTLKEERLFRTVASTTFEGLVIRRAAFFKSKSSGSTSDNWRCWIAALVGASLFFNKSPNACRPRTSSRRCCFASISCFLKNY